MFGSMDLRQTNQSNKEYNMKRFLIIALFCITYMQTYAQEAIIYYEGGVKEYPIEYYAYQFQLLSKSDCESVNNTIISDSTFLAFLDAKIESAKRCINEGDCSWEATHKPSPMIQVVYIKNKYCYYTINLSSGWDVQNSLTIDGKSCFPDQELQDVVLEIVKYRVVYKQVISAEKIHAILAGERMKEEEAPYWPWL